MSDHSERDLTVKGGEKPKKRGLKWFFIDLWWVHLIVLIVVVLCVTLPLIYVGMPRIAQSDVNDANLNITRMSITQPRPDGFTLNLSTVLTSGSTFHPTLRTWTGNLYLQGTNQPYLTLQIPEIVAKNGSVTDINTVITLQKSQLDPFANFVKALVGMASVTSYLVGRGPLKLGALPTTNVNYNKTLLNPGFNGLAGISISNSRLLTTPQPDNATLAGQVSIPNTSPGAVELGNLTFGLSLPAELLGTALPTPLGTATVNNTLLLPNQPNVFDLRSVANQTLVVAAVGRNASLLQTGLPINIQTTRVEYKGQEIPWLTSALASSPITQILNISEILSSATGGGGGTTAARRDIGDNMNGWLI